MADLAAIKEMFNQMKEELTKDIREEIRELKENHEKEVSGLKGMVVVLREEHHKVSDKHVDLPSEKISKISKTLETKLEEVNWKDATSAHHFIKELSKEFSELSIKDFFCMRAAYVKMNKDVKTPPMIIDENPNIDTYLSKLLEVSEDYQGAGFFMRTYKAELPIMKNKNTSAANYDEAFKRLLEKQRFCFDQCIKASHEKLGLREKLGKGPNDEIRQTYIEHQKCMTLSHYRIMFGQQEFHSYAKFFEGYMPCVEITNIGTSLIILFLAPDMLNMGAEDLAEP